jgi:hypothetical protein
MASFLAKHKAAVNPDRALYQAVDEYFKVEFPEDYEIYNAMNLYKMNIVKIMKTGKTLKDSIKILEQNTSTEV